MDGGGLEGLIIEIMILCEQSLQGDGSLLESNYSLTKHIREHKAVVFSKQVVSGEIALFT